MKAYIVKKNVLVHDSPPHPVFIFLNENLAKQISHKNDNQWRHITTSGWGGGVGRYPLPWACSFGHLLGPNSPVESVRNRFLWGTGLRNWFSTCIVKFWSLEGRKEQRTEWQLSTLDLTQAHCIHAFSSTWSSTQAAHKLTLQVISVMLNLYVFICFLICAFYKIDSQFICHLNQLDLKGTVSRDFLDSIFFINLLLLVLLEVP